MSPQRWDEVKEMIQKEYGVEYHDMETIGEHPGETEVLEFEGPLGYMRAEYSTRPRQTGRSVHTAGRPKSLVQEEVTYSDTEEVHALHLFLWNDEADDWKEVDMKL